MKGLKNIIIAAVMTIGAALTFSSCNRDTVANQLEGYWEGTITNTTFYRTWNGNYRSTNITYIDLEFLNDITTYSSGDGTEWSYANSYRDNSTVAFANDFWFTVNNVNSRYNTSSGTYYTYEKVIDIRFKTCSDQMQIYIQRFNGNTFYGYIVNNGVDIGDCVFTYRNTYRSYNSVYSSSYYNGYNGYYYNTNGGYYEYNNGYYNNGYYIYADSTAKKPVVADSIR